MKEKFFIYYRDMSDYDFGLLNSESDAIAKAKEAVDEGKAGTVWIGKLLKVARRDVTLSNE